MTFLKDIKSRPLSSVCLSESPKSAGGACREPGGIKDFGNSLE